MALIAYEEAIALLAEEERGEGWLPYCERRGIFQLPTAEWAGALAAKLVPLGAERILEVGAGGGALGRALIERGIAATLTDPAGSGDVERLSVREALGKHRPDLVLSCWLPFDLGAEKIILADPGVRWYLALVQTGPGFAGPEGFLGDPAWSAERVGAADRWSVSRADFLDGVDRGAHVRRGAAFLLTRNESQKAEGEL